MTIRRRRFIIGLGTITVVGGMTGIAFAESDMPVARNVSTTGIVTAIGGFIAILGTQVQPILKIYLDNQRLQYDVQTAVKEAREERRQIMERIAYIESLVVHSYRKLLPDEVIPRPPDLPRERETIEAATQTLSRKV